MKRDIHKGSYSYSDSYIKSLYLICASQCPVQRQFILLPVQVAGKAVTGPEKTKGTKSIAKIKLTPVTLSLCNWRNLNWISLTERCWHWEIAQTWEALAGQRKGRGKKSFPTYSLKCPPMFHFPISHCLGEIILASPANLITRCGPQRRPPIFHVQPVKAGDVLPTHLRAIQRATVCTESSWTHLHDARWPVGQRQEPYLVRFHHQNQPMLTSNEQTDSALGPIICLFAQ